MNNNRQHAPSFPRADIQTLLCQWDRIPHQVLQYHECPSILSYFNSIVLVLLLNSTTCVRIVNTKLKLQNKTGSNIRRGTFCLFCMNLHIYSIAKIDIIIVIKVETFLPVTSLLLGLLQYKIQNINISLFFLKNAYKGSRNAWFLVSHSKVGRSWWWCDWSWKRNKLEEKIIHS